MQAFESALVDVVRESRESVVAIRAQDVTTPVAASPRLRGRRIPHTSGAGFFIHPDGYILTNDHVVHDAVDIYVTLSGGERLEATLTGTDANTDLAVIKVELDEPARVMPPGDSDAAQVGQFVISLGNPLSLDFSANIGIISAKGRGNLIGGGDGDLIRYQDFIQTDAYMNRGNSGGPLINLRGEAIGVNSMIRTQGRDSDEYIGLGFAIPMKIAASVSADIIEHGHVIRGWLGIEFRSTPEGIRVLRVVPGSPAQVGDLRAGDVITAVDGVDLRGGAPHVEPAFKWTIATAPLDTGIPFAISRDGTSETLTVALQQMPDEYSGVTRLRFPLVSALGVRVRPLPAEAAVVHGFDKGDEGLIIEDVSRDGVAAAAGVGRGALIVSVGGLTVYTTESLEATLRHAAGSSSRPISIEIKLRNTAGTKKLAIPSEPFRKLLEDKD
ncbi:PDZ domain-containing protein [Candidatus Poribacteria bacterium]|nr:PDZ domain-containing protein [Candidatus Poribacteria bacterium]MBT5534348.1 PDZ domain-containing protein [Candidatus Poribacteria bacterium]MBT5709627.1 PDZ domain-containing protein [Candidatus Poribacteria bacterium]MBT7097321.1 PDZ domain-containing protein [Candidatus Poribacteria bacterium]MBT7807653.1 PDZ domain-containing protein [Candidatus Poribacteria bacterium]